MVTRATDDYEAMALSGCVAVTEPSFWAGFDRKTPGAFTDYFHHLTVVEPARASRFGIRHYAWLCVNPKEAEDVGLAREVMARIPDFLERPGVLGIGEIGLNRISRNEIRIFEEQVDLAVRHRRMILAHTPHLEDKLKGTRMIVEILSRNGTVDPAGVVVDHVEEHTARLVLDAGFWAGITLYPGTKCSVPRAVDMLERYGTERVLVNSAADWGPSDPLAVPRLRLEMRLRGHAPETIRQVVLRNPIRFLSRSGGFVPPAGIA